MFSIEKRFPSIAALRAFEAAARLGSFGQASEELAITASALSKRISSLEQLVGALLFDRVGRAIRLTVAGKEYFEQVRQVLNQLGSIGLHSKTAQSTQRIRVVAPPTFAREILIPNLSSFTAKNSVIEIEVVVAIPYLNTEIPDADLMVGFGPRSIGQPLLFEPVFAVAAPGFSKKHQIKAVKDLVRAKSPVPLVRCPIEPWATWFAALGLFERDVNFKGGLKLVDLGLMLEAAAHGHGVGLARNSIARRWLSEGTLVRLFPEIEVASTEGYSLSIRHATSQAVAFSQWLHGVCRKLESKASY